MSSHENLVKIHAVLPSRLRPKSAGVAVLDNQARYLASADKRGESEEGLTDFDLTNLELLSSKWKLVRGARQRRIPSIERAVRGVSL